MLSFFLELLPLESLATLDYNVANPLSVYVLIFLPYIVLMHQCVSHMLVIRALANDLLGQLIGLSLWPVLIVSLENIRDCSHLQTKAIHLESFAEPSTLQLGNDSVAPSLSALLVTCDF